MKNLISGFVAIILVILIGLGCSRFGTKTVEDNAVANKTVGNNSNGNSANGNNSTSSANSKQASNSGDLSGDYSVKGINPQGDTYANDLTVKKQDDIYQFSWKSLSGKSSDGVAVQDGDLVAVGLSNGTDSEGCGAVVYKITGNGLEGKLAISGSKDLITQTATLVSHNKTSGVFVVQSEDSHGPYKFNMTVKETGDVYQVYSRFKDGSMVGTGFKKGDYLAVGVGQQNCSWAAYLVKDGNLGGIWGTIGSTQYGSETATRK